jgi:hypothetical protein
VRRHSLVFAAVLALSLTGCASKPWDKYPIERLPDSSCQTGYESGYDVFIWNCLKDEHVVVYQTTSVFFRMPAKIEKTSCNQLTEFEVNNEFKDGKSPQCRRQLAWKPKQP